MIRISFFVVALCLLTACGPEAPFYDIAPPLVGIAPVTDTVEIDPTIEQEVKFSNGYRVNVPANAFCDAAGNAVTGKVRLTVSAMNTTAAILASGVPMRYSEDGKEYDFESAGMFDIRGYSGDAAISIAKDKRLSVSTPSSANGDYDVFLLEEQNAGKMVAAGIGSGSQAPTSFKKARWKKLTNTVNDKFNASNVIKEFRLKFDTLKYPQLAALAGINWKLANPNTDPTIEENKWALDTAWDYLEISQPKYVMGKTRLNRRCNDIVFPAILYRSKMKFTEFYSETGHDYLFFPNSSSTVVWSVQERKGIEIPAVVYTYETEGRPKEYRNRYRDTNYFLGYQGNACYLFNFRGKRLGRFDSFYVHHIIPEKQIAICTDINAEGISDTTVTICDLTGKPLHRMTLRNEQSDPEVADHHTYFYLTVNDELIADNAGGGVQIFDLSGRELYSSKYSYRGQIGDDSLLLATDKRIIIWDYKKGSTKEHNTPNGYRYTYASRMERSPLISYEDDYGHECLWNFHTDNVTCLKMKYSVSFGADSKLVYGEDESTFYIYDLEKGKYVVSIPIPSTNTYYSIHAAMRGDRILVIFEKKALLFDRSGKLIADIAKNTPSHFNSGFVSEDTLYAVSQTGVFRLLDKKGGAATIHQAGKCRGY